MELLCCASVRFRQWKPLSKPAWCCGIRHRFIPGGAKYSRVVAVTATSRSSSDSSGNSGKSKRGRKAVSSRSRGSSKSTVIELPEVLYRFTDASGNHACVIERDGTVSRISVITHPLINPLASFAERDIDPSSSQPVVPTSILATILPPSTALNWRDDDNDGGGGGAGMGGRGDSSVSGCGGGVAASSALSGNTYGSTSNAVGSPKGLSMIITPLPGASSSAAAALPGGGATASIVTSPASATDLVALSRTITIERNGPSLSLQALIKALQSWQAANILRWLRWAGRRHRRKSTARATADAASPGGTAVTTSFADGGGGEGPGAAEGATAGTVTAATASEADATDGGTDIDYTTSTDSSDIEDSSDSDDTELLWDPLLLGALTLGAAALSAGALVAMAAAADTAAAAAAVAAAALASPPAPAPVKWMQLNPVPGMAHEAATAVHWHLRTWTELSNQVLEPMSRAFQKWSYAALPIKIAFVLVSSVPLVVVFGLLYFFAVGGRPAGQSLLEALVKIHCILNRMPGTNMVRENNAASFLVVNAAFFTGLFTFAIFLGIVSDEVKTTFRSIKTGDYPVRVRDHVLVLNWSHHTIPLLRQYDLAQQYAGNDTFFRRPVVLLSDNPKQDMDNEIAERLKSNSLEVITRSGSTAMLRDLSTVAAASAHTIIVLHPGGAASHASAEAAKASTAMALAALTATEEALAARASAGGGSRGGNGLFDVVGRAQALSSAFVVASQPAPGSAGRRLPRVLFQMPDEVGVAQDPVSSFTKSSPANISGNMQALSITDASVIDRFTCQAAVQPGMLRIWASVLQHGPRSIKALMVPVPPQLVGITFADARRQYADAVLIGVMRANGHGINGSSSSSTGGSSSSSAGGSSSVASAASDYRLHMDLPALDSWELAVGDVFVMFVPARVAGIPRASSVTATLFPQAAAAAAERIKRHGGYNALPKRVIMAGYQWQDVADVAAAFSDSAPDRSEVTFILQSLPSQEAGDPELPGSSGSCRIRYVDARGTMISLRALHEAGIKTADAVVLRPPIQDMERWCAKKPVTARIREADAMVMAGLIQVQDAVIASGRTDPPHVVARLNRYGSTETALRYFEMLSPSPQPQLQPQQQPQQLQPHHQQQQQQQLQQTLKEGPQPQPQQLQQQQPQQQLLQQHVVKDQLLQAEDQNEGPNLNHHHNHHNHQAQWLGWWPHIHFPPAPEVAASTSTDEPLQSQLQPSSHTERQQVAAVAAAAAAAASRPAGATVAFHPSAQQQQQHQSLEQINPEAHAHHDHYHHNWWRIWRAIPQPFRRTHSTAVVGTAGAATAEPSLASSSAEPPLTPGAAALTGARVHPNGHRMWALRGRADLEYHGANWSTRASAPASGSTPWVVKGAGLGIRASTAAGLEAAPPPVPAAPLPQPQPQPKQLQQRQKDAGRDTAHYQKEQHQAAVAGGAPASNGKSVGAAAGGGGGSGSGGNLQAGSVAVAAAAATSSSQLPPPPPPLQAASSEPGHSHGLGQGRGLPVAAAAAAAQPPANAGAAAAGAMGPAAAVEAVGGVQSRSSGGTAAAPPLASLSSPGGVNASAAAGGSSSSSSTAASTLAAAEQQQQQQRNVSSGPTGATYTRPASAQPHHDGPLAAMQAVMMGAIHPALPIGNEGSSGTPSHSPVQAATSGAAAASLVRHPGTASSSSSAAAAAGLADGSGGTNVRGVGGSGNGGGASAASNGLQGGGSTALGAGPHGNGATPAGSNSCSSSAGSGAIGSTAAGAGSSSGSASSNGNSGVSTSGSSSGSSSSSGASSSSTSSSTSTSSTSGGGGAPVLGKRPIIRNPEIFLADDLIGALLTQVAAQPSYAQLVSQLTVKDGAELYLRNPAVFNIAPGERLSFAELSETTRLLCQVALGVVRADGRCCLVPKPHELLDFEPGDQVLVLSDDYRIRRK